MAVGHRISRVLRASVWAGAITAGNGGMCRIGLVNGLFLDWEQGGTAGKPCRWRDDF
jgi:hypothetical protein